MGPRGRQLFDWLFEREVVSFYWLAQAMLTALLPISTRVAFDAPLAAALHRAETLIVLNTAPITANRQKSAVKIDRCVLHTDFGQLRCPPHERSIRMCFLASRGRCAPQEC